MVAANASVHAILGPAKIPFPLPNPDACTPSGVLPCPLNPGTYVYESVLTIPSYTPVVRWRPCLRHSRV